jgi:phage/plasmid-like protein (TIGR03299 family)
VSHEISVVGGIEEAVYTSQPAWHGLGMIVEDAPSAKEAIEFAHLTWRVEQLKVYTSEDKVIPGKLANVRSDTREPLAIVSTRYRPIQNIEAFQFVDELLREGEVKYEACGALRGGKTIWLLARLPDQIDIAGVDTQKAYMLFTNTHDATGACRILPTTVRVVCQNTLRLALGGTNPRKFSIAHIGDVRRKVREAREALGITRKAFQIYGELGNELAKVQVHADMERQYLRTLFPVGTDDEPNPANDRARDMIADIFHTAEAEVFDGKIRGTAWGLLSSTTDYVDHLTKARGASTRFSSSWIGTGSRVKQSALELAQEMFIS